jgi:hypothetical protein
MSGGPHNPDNIGVVQFRHHYNFLCYCLYYTLLLRSRIPTKWHLYVWWKEECILLHLTVFENVHRKEIKVHCTDLQQITINLLSHFEEIKLSWAVYVKIQAMAEMYTLLPLNRERCLHSSFDFRKWCSDVYLRLWLLYIEIPVLEPFLYKIV